MRKQPPHLGSGLMDRHHKRYLPKTKSGSARSFRQNDLEHGKVAKDASTSGTKSAITI